MKRMMKRGNSAALQGLRGTCVGGLVMALGLVCACACAKPPAKKAKSPASVKEPVEPTRNVAKKAKKAEKPAKLYERGSERVAMVRNQLVRRGIHNKAVLKVMEQVPRHLFVPKNLQHMAYNDHPVPIGMEQTISQPYIVAYMTEALAPKAGQRVLEIGTGSGYQAAVLAELVGRVYTIEIVALLGKRAHTQLDTMGYKNIHFRIGDGYKGWPEAAPFDGIMLTAAPPKIPQPLLDQLKVGGVMIAPVGTMAQELLRITRTATGYTRESVMGVRFVPMTGEAQEKQ